MTDGISIREACELLSVTKMTIYNHIKRGNLHPIKKMIGRGHGGQRVFLSRAEVIALRDGDQPLPPPVEETKNTPSKQARNRNKK